MHKAVSLIGKNVTAVQGDVSKLEDLDRLYETVPKVKGRVDIVFANAGVVDPVIAGIYEAGGVASIRSMALLSSSDLNPNGPGLLLYTMRPVASITYMRSGHPV